MNTLHSWLLLAISISAREGAAPLDHVIGSADAINHAVPTTEEVHSTFRWLAEAGLIAPAGYQVALTDSGAALVKAALSELREHDSWMSRLNVLNGRLLGVEASPLSSELESRLPNGTQIQKALHVYQERAQQALGVSLESVNAMHAQLVNQAASYRPFHQRLAAAVARLFPRR